MKRKICVVTGSRAEYGLLYWIIKGIHEDRELELLLIVTGMHLSREFGLTVKIIENDGFPIAQRIDVRLSSDSEVGIASSIGFGIPGFAKAYARLKPDILLVLGDRFEILAAVSAALPFRIPVAHIHGGESTEGLIDESIRHAVSKMSHIHFASTEKYRRRIIQMGESSACVFSYGAPGLDNIYKLKLLNREKIFRELGIPQGKKVAVVTYHPVTLEKNTSGFQINELVAAIKKFSDMYFIFTYGNADTEGRVIIDKIKSYIKKYPESGKVFISLGQVKYLSLLKQACVMIGNSSSGIIEAASFELPVVNIGDRQRGRLHGKNVINVKECKRDGIKNAMRKALSDKFKHSLRGLKNPYGDGSASREIVNKLKAVKLGEKLIKKHFYEISP